MSHLLKACHTWIDFGLGDFRLWYLRDREKREVDTLITRDNSPWLMVEIKWIHNTFMTVLKKENGRRIPT